MMQQMRAELIERGDSLFELLEQQIYQNRTELNSAMEDMQHAISGAGLIRPEEYPAFQSRFRGSEKLLRERLLLHVEVLRGRKRVLDIGCGDGLFLKMLGEAGIDATGVDSNKAMIESARQHGLKVLQQDVLTAVDRLAPGEYDAITAFHVIEHLPAAQLRQFLEHCYEILPEDGMLLLEMPNISNITTLTRSYFADPTHMMPRDPRLISFMLESIGFGEVLLSEINNYPKGEQFIQDFPTSELSSDSELAVQLQRTLEICENTFARLNALFYVGMDVAFKAIKTGARESQ